MSVAADGMPQDSVSAEELLEQGMTQRDANRMSYHVSLLRALSIIFERWAHVYICWVMLGFWCVLIWSNMVFDAHRGDLYMLQKLYIVVTVYVFRKDFYCHNPAQDGLEEPWRARLFRRLTLISVFLGPIVGGTKLAMTRESNAPLKSAVMAIVIYYVVVAFVAVVIPGCFLSVMLVLVRRGLVRMPRPATAAPEELAENLPKVAYDPQFFIKGSDASPFPVECCICCDEFEERQTISQTPCPARNHVFHTECLTNWLQLQHTCPLCRHDVTQPAPTDLVAPTEDSGMDSVC